MRLRAPRTVAVALATLVGVGAATAFTGLSNLRERPTQLADSAAAEGLVGAMRQTRVLKLARVFDELMAMPAPGEPGGPRTTLNWRELIDFAEGRLAFKRTFTESEGLGPGFNERSCAGCHSHPTLGGGGEDMTVSVQTIAPPDDPRDTVGTHKYAVPGHKLRKLPANTPRRRTPPLYGIGLLDAIPDRLLAAMADPDDKNGDGIKGVLNVRGHPAGGMRPARFGHKSNEPNLLRFIGGALFGEMGITNRASRARPRDGDQAKDPEAPAGYVASVDAYVRGLAPPPRGATTPASARGEQLFATIGCTGCHRPAIGSIKGAYTDMLIHDMGPNNSDGLYDGKAGPTSWRTPALWGLRFKRRYLHDERADNIHAVLAFHGGEAMRAAARFRGLTKTDQTALLAFLRSL